MEEGLFIIQENQVKYLRMEIKLDFILLQHFRI